jgi:ABC-type Fe3+/spermidine/putrescine transport system ATPase subunit
VTALSGGQQQRVAVARALAPAPRLLLLDEPLSNLDPALRERTRRSIRELVGRLGITTVLVTHEQEEAFDLASRVAVLWAGELQQVGTPEELYERPANRVVARFIGRANLLRGPLRRRGEGWGVEVAPGVVWGGELHDVALEEGAAAELMLRADVLAATPATPAAGGGTVASAESDAALPGTIAERRYAGPASRFVVALAGGLEVEVLAPSASLTVGVRVAVAPRPGGPRPRIWAAGAPE